MQGVSCFAVLRRWEGQGSDIFVGQASGCHEGLGACLATLWQQGWYGNPWRILAQDPPWRLASDAGFWAVGGTYGAPRRTADGTYMGLNSTCRFLPSESLMTPSGVRSRGVSTIFSSVAATSLTRRPPPLIC